MYQPLLHLENEVLNVDNMLLGNQDTFLKWQDLDLRATAYLPGNDPILGIIHMNSAMSFFRKGDDDRGIELSYAAIEILQKNLPLALHPLVNAMTNLSIIHSQNDRFEEALKLLKEMHIIREKYDMKNDPSAAAASNALGLAYQRSGNYENASAQFKLAVRMHQAQDQKYKNDAYLLSILNNLSISLFLEKKHEESVANQIAALKIADNLKIYNTKPFRETLDTLYSLYIKLGKKEEAEALKIIYEGKYF
ncbi:tetratricopeptide repeat protein [Chryseobacterium aahli]|uniref:tetratricopeptide repeat protein n=1 Tax=Chryseobacterium aahli TaxID=1278643 RepID=UPI001F603ACE|nr:tetratricopeptide repeat protein [Chryseobacterium aahli]MCI3938595.1 tetratricopeptide repeat protein [Chryseobacterium aahli]